MCYHCGSNYKLKRERGVNKYICSAYDNKGTCIRITFQEAYLIELIEKRLNKKVDATLINEHVEKIVIEDKFLFEIFIYNQETILFSKGGIRF